MNPVATNRRLISNALQKKKFSRIHRLQLRILLSTSTSGLPVTYLSFSTPDCDSSFMVVVGPSSCPVIMFLSSLVCMSVRQWEI